MNMGGDAAERLVRDSLMITEEAVKLAGLGAKNLAAILVALAKEEEKTHGPTHLTRLPVSYTHLSKRQSLGEGIYQSQEKGKTCHHRKERQGTYESRKGKIRQVETTPLDKRKRRAYLPNRLCTA